VDILADVEDVGVRDGRLSSDWGIEEMEDVAGGRKRTDNGAVVGRRWW
jgi:hypothetical protein